MPGRSPRVTIYERAIHCGRTSARKRGSGMNQADGPGRAQAGIIPADSGQPYTGSSGTVESPLQRTAANPSIANPARVYDALLGGKDNYAADRAVAEKV